MPGAAKARIARRPQSPRNAAEPHAAAPEHRLQGYLESRRYLARSLERCVCPQTSRFLAMIKSEVENRIRELGDAQTHHSPGRQAVEFTAPRSAWTGDAATP